MAQQLWMLRHGEAVPHDSKPDAERELTPRGRLQAEAAGGALAALSAEFAACYTSPKVRARETAELACAYLNIEPVLEDSLADVHLIIVAMLLLMTALAAVPAAGALAFGIWLRRELERTAG